MFTDVILSQMGRRKSKLEKTRKMAMMMMRKLDCMWIMSSGTEHLLDACETGHLNSMSI